MSKFTASMFDTIKQTLASQKPTGNYKDILKLEIGNTYFVRIVPNMTDPQKTFFHYFNHIWNSLSTGQLTSALCPTAWGERCPICEARIKLFKTNTDESKKFAAKLRRQENWLTNVYVIKDPKNEENNGKVKILRYGKQLDKIITDAISGDDAEEFGAKIFDLAEGCTLRIKVEKNEGGFATYVSSKFVSPSKIESINVDQIYGEAKQLDKLFEQKSVDQLKKLVSEHVYCEHDDNRVESSKVESSKVESSKVESQENPVEASSKTVAPNKPTADSSSSEVDAKLNDLLKDLN